MSEPKAVTGPRRSLIGGGARRKGSSDPIENWARFAVHHQIGSTVRPGGGIGQPLAVGAEGHGMVHDPLDGNFTLAVHEEPLLAPAAGVYEPFSVRTEGRGN